MRPVRVVLIAGSLVLLATGCSSSTDDATSSTPSRAAAATVVTTALDGPSGDLSEAEWRAQADAICAETGPTIGEAFGAMDPTSPTPAQVDHVVDTLVSVNRDTEARIDALAEPATLGDQVEALLAANDEATDAIEEQGPAALDALDQLFATANELAAELGLDSCVG